jgi:hypothetical protein
MGKKKMKWFSVVCGRVLAQKRGRPTWVKFWREKFNELRHAVLVGQRMRVRRRACA